MPELEQMLSSALIANTTTEDAARELFDAIDPFSYGEFLLAALAALIEARRVQPRPAQTAGAGTSVATRDPSTARSREGDSADRSRPKMSVKQALIRDQYWPQFLSRTIELPSGSKALGDATPDDLRLIANQQRLRASEMAQIGARFDRLAHVMDDAGVTVLSHLDPTVGQRVLGAK